MKVTRREFNGFFVIKQIEKPLKKWGKTLDYVLCLFLHFFLSCSSRLLRVLQQNRAH